MDDLLDVIGTLGLVIFFIVALLWVLVPFLIIGVSNRLSRILDLLHKLAVKRRN